jgi:hypothetical protein
MLIRISLIIAIIAGLAAGALSFLKVKEKIDTVVTERNDWNQKYVKTDQDLTSTKATLAKTEKDLTKTKETLAKTEQERAAAVAEAEIQIKKSTDLSEKLTVTIRERDDARAELQAYVATGYKPEQIAGLGKQIKAAQDALEVSVLEKKIIQRELDKTVAKLRSLTEEDYVVQLDPKLRGKILVADPKWEFVVLNVGEDEGAELNGELLVSRDGRLVAKLIIKDVQKGRSIANVIPGWKLADVTEGDQVIPAHPKS